LTSIFCEFDWGSSSNCVLKKTKNLKRTGPSIGVAQWKMSQDERGSEKARNDNIEWFTDKDPCLERRKKVKVLIKSIVSLWCSGLWTETKFTILKAQLF
jgi:hypothetical protein